jgi:hypothetical protein
MRRLSRWICRRLCPLTGCTWILVHTTLAAGSFSWTGYKQVCWHPTNVCNEATGGVRRFRASAAERLGEASSATLTLKRGTSQVQDVCTRRLHHAVGTTSAPAGLREHGIRKGAVVAATAALSCFRWWNRHMLCSRGCTEPTAQCKNDALCKLPLTAFDDTTTPRRKKVCDLQECHPLNTRNVGTIGSCRQWCGTNRERTPIG